MKIISHRGCWNKECEKNTLIAFERSFKLGFGTETDFRDRNSELVISHDIPGTDVLSADEFFNLFAKHDVSLQIAMNIKSDGLQQLISRSIIKYNLTNFFLFDMSVPDAMVSINRGIKVYTRQSEIEPIPAYYRAAAGVWMDAFTNDDWITPQVAIDHIEEGKKVCIVSPEIHKRPHEKLWSRFKQVPKSINRNITLCTDMPEIAAAYFENEKD